MKYYIIEDNNGDYNNLFVVKANNKKEAFSKFWKFMNYDNQVTPEGYVPHRKKDFEVMEITDDVTILN